MTTAAALAQTARLELPDGQVTIQLLNDDGEPLTAAKLPEKSEAVVLELAATGSVAVGVELRLVAVEVLGLEPGTVLKQATHRFARDGGAWRASFPLGARAEIGRYRVEAVAGDAQATLPFVVAPLHRPAVIVEAADPDRLNVALTALGGRVLWASSAERHHLGRWAAGNLIDGFVRIRNRDGGLVSSGWRSERGNWPAEVVIGFYDERAPLVDTLVLEPVAVDRSLPADFSGTAPRTEGPRFVEILVGETPEPGTFESLGTVRLWNRTVPQLIQIEPQPIRYLMLRVIESYGADTTALAELRVLEVAGGESILADVGANLARPALGGGVVAFTSQSRDNLVTELVDGVVGSEFGWSSAPNAAGDAARLPQDLVFGFNGDRIAEIERVEIDLKSSPRYSVGSSFDENWPRLISIGVASESPNGPFEEIGRFELAREAGPQTIPVGRTARYLRVRVLENHGGKRTTIGEIAVVEATHPAGGSVLVGHADPAWVGATAPEAALALPTGRAEVEPNDDETTSAALPFGTIVLGAIEPADDIDRFALAVTGEGPQTVTLDLRADGRLRLTLDLIDRSGMLVKRFLPQARTGNQARLTWRLEPGDYWLAVSELERVTALVWDTSGSMVGRSEALERAVRGYVEALGQHESLVLIRFSDRVESLLPEPSRDAALIQEALTGRFRPDGGTHLFDAVAEALNVLDGATGQKTIIALTDGQDTGSTTSFADLRRRLAASDVRLITIGLGPDLDDLGLAMANTGHGVLRSLAQATGGRYAVEPRSEDLPALYAALAEELSGVQRYALQVEVVEAMGALAVRQVGEPIPAIAAAPRVTLVLDGSGSMKRKLDGRPMIEIAREVLTEVVSALPDGVEAGLWSFGHRVREGQAGDCTDVEELVPLGPLDRKRMLKQLVAVRALGTTPIAETLERVGATLPRDGGDNLIILVTDGEEECRDDLLEVTEALAQQGLELSLNIVGFALDRPAVLEQLAAAAAAGKGRFVNAAAAAELSEALEAALAPPFAVLDATGDLVLEGTIGAPPMELPAGFYDLRIETSDAPLLIRDVEVVADATVDVLLDKQGEEIGVTIGAPRE